ncbi:unnamed protein product [Calypogeia fissa]
MSCRFIMGVEAEHFIAFSTIIKCARTVLPEAIESQKMAKASGGVVGETSESSLAGEVSEEMDFSRPELDFEDLDMLYVDELLGAEDVDLNSIDI